MPNSSNNIHQYQTAAARCSTLWGDFESAEAHNRANGREIFDEDDQEGLSPRGEITCCIFLRVFLRLGFMINLSRLLNSINSLSPRPARLPMTTYIKKRYVF
jgi:hypothetical protein